MTEISDAIRVGVLGSPLRGMSLDYAARADGVTVAQAEELARAAGWPADMTAVYAERQLMLGPPPAGELVARAEREYRGEVVQTGPTPGHREPLAEYVARVVAPIEAALNAELDLPPGVRVEVDTTPLLSEREQDERAYSDAVRATSETVQEQPLDPLPPATDSPAPPGPKSRQLPCEVCGVGVLTSYVETTGRQRHGHHPEGS